MKIYFECTYCKQVEPINIVALSANGFGLQCSVCKTYFTFGVVAVEQLRAVDLPIVCADCGETERFEDVCKKCGSPNTASH